MRSLDLGGITLTAYAWLHWNELALMEGRVMAFRYERDDGRQRVVVVYSGSFQVEDVFATLARLRSEGVWLYGLIADFREVNTSPSMAEVRAILDEMSKTLQRGPVAILVGDTPHMYGLACSYVELGRSIMRSAVFRYRDEAEKWLSGIVGD